MQRKKSITVPNQSPNTRITLTLTYDTESGTYAVKEEQETHTALPTAAAIRDGLGTWTTEVLFRQHGLRELEALAFWNVLRHKHGLEVVGTLEDMKAESNGLNPSDYRVAAEDIQGAVKNPDVLNNAYTRCYEQYNLDD